MLEIGVGRKKVGRFVEAVTCGDAVRGLAGADGRPRWVTTLAILAILATLANRRFSMMKLRAASLTIATTMLLCWATTGQAQIFTDTEFLAANYDSSTARLGDIRYNVDYSSINIFGDGFVVASLPPAPRTTDGSTTGIFLSANNDSQNASAGQAAFAAALPKNLSVGNGTANKNYVVRVDVFNSAGTGLDDGTGAVDQTGTTNYSMLGLNQANTTVQVEELNAPASGNLPGQGLALGITGDSGAAEDYMPIYGGAVYRDRTGSAVPGQTYRGNPNNGAPGMSGLIGNILNNYWLSQGLGYEFTDTDTDPSNDLDVFTGDSLFASPDPTDLAGYLSNGTGVDRRVYSEAIGVTTGPVTHYSGTFSTANSIPVDYDSGTIAPGIPGNRWSTHEMFWVDDQFTYVVDGIPVLQIVPDADGLNGDDNVYDDFSDAGTVILGFWDRFSSIAASPEGANFVVYDNLEVAEATAADVPNVMQYLAANGFLLGGANDPADFDGDGDVDGDDFATWEAAFGQTAAGDTNNDGVSDGSDFLTWQRNFTGPALSNVSAAGVPEPTTAILGLALLFGHCAIGRRRD
jgi:hypothetical protein